MLIRSFAFVIDTESDLTLYGQSRQFPPAVICTWPVSDFWGMML